MDVETAESDRLYERTSSDRTPLKGAGLSADESLTREERKRLLKIIFWALLVIFALLGLMLGLLLGLIPDNSTPSDPCTVSNIEKQISKAGHATNLHKAQIILGQCPLIGILSFFFCSSSFFLPPPTHSLSSSFGSF